MKPQQHGFLRKDRSVVFQRERFRQNEKSDESRLLLALNETDNAYRIGTIVIKQKRMKNVCSEIFFVMINAFFLLFCVILICVSSAFPDWSGW